MSLGTMGEMQVDSYFERRSVFMHYLKNMAMLSINGLTMVAYGFALEYLMQTFNITSFAANASIIVGSVIAFLPLIFKLDVVTHTSEREQSVLFFWKRRTCEAKTIQQISFLGLVPIHTQTLHTTATIDQPDFKATAKEILAICVPVANGYLSTAKNVKRIK